MFDPIFIEDLGEAFKPLLEHAKTFCGTEGALHRFMDKWMYMHSDKTHSFFKHVDTREYLKLRR